MHQVPQPGSAVCGRGKCMASTREGQSAHGAMEISESRHQPIITGRWRGCCVPEEHGLVSHGRGEHGAVGIEGQGVYLPRMHRERSAKEVPLCYIPEANGLVGAARRQNPAIRTEGKAGDPISMSRQRLAQWAQAPHVPQAYGAVIACRRQDCAVGTEGDTLHRVCMPD
jgi:hypothetical protein